jgi:hypothetical protein
LRIGCAIDPGHIAGTEPCIRLPRYCGGQALPGEKLLWPLTEMAPRAVTQAWLWPISRKFRGIGAARRARILPVAAMSTPRKRPWRTIPTSHRRSTSTAGTSAALEPAALLWQYLGAFWRLLP